MLLYGTDAFPNQEESALYGGVVVQWKPVEGALGYRVEIKNTDNEKVTSLDVTTSRLDYRLPEGKYYIRIGAINRFSRVDSFSDWSLLKVIESVAPVISSISLSQFFSGEEVKGISIKGSDIREGTKVYILNKKNRVEGNKYRYISDKEVVFDLDLDDALPGRYDLVAENPAGQRAVKENLVLVKKPSVDLSDLPAGTVYFTGGWGYSYIFADWSDVYENSSLGFTFTAGFNLRTLDAVKSIPVLRSVSIEGDFIFTSYESMSRTGIVDTTLLQYIAGAGLCWSAALPADFTMCLRAGCGIVFSSFSEKREFGESRDFGSRDFFWKAGISFQYEIAAGIFAEADVTYLNIIYSEKVFQNLMFGMGAGYRI